MKKNPNHLEARRPSLLLVGLMASLSLTLVAFEWTGFNYEDPDHVDTAGMAAWEEPIPIHKVVREQPDKPKNRKARSPIVKVGEPVKGKTEFSLKAVLAGLDTGSDEDYDEPGEPTGPETINWALLGNKPHYADCENIVDREAQATCTEAFIINFIAKNTKFPRDLRGKSETVYVNFVIDTDGTIVEVEPLRKAHPLFERAALRAVKKLPRMVPGEQLGKPVRVRFLIPVRFTTAP